MADIVQIIQAILNFQNSGKTVELTLKDGTSVSGSIEAFSGRTVEISGMSISTAIIEAVREKIEFDPQLFMMNRINICAVIDGKETVIDGVLLSGDAEQLTFIDSNGQSTVRMADVSSISDINGAVLYSATVSMPEEAPQEESPEEDTKPTVPQPEKTIADLDEDDEEDEDGEKPYEMNAFEKAVVYGDTMTVNDFLEGRRSLRDEGYSEEEATRIRETRLAVNWGQDPLRIAQRLMVYQGNKNDLAKSYFITAINSFQKGSPEYVTAVNEIFPLITEDDNFQAFWRKNRKHITSDVLDKKLEQAYIQRSIRDKGIVPNEFERALISADKAAVERWIRENDLEELGYSIEDIERARKAFPSTNWETNWYRTATRIYGIQVNKNKLAETYYEAALAVADKKGTNYTKILNALASIKLAEGYKSFRAFFRAHKARLQSNSNYCIAYANALITLGDFKTLSKEMPMLREQLAGRAEDLERIEEDLRYYETMPEFKIQDIGLINDRMNTLREQSGIDPENLSDENQLELNLITQLPAKAALMSLLEFYRLHNEEDIFFALADYAFPLIKSDKSSMKELLFMLKSCENDSYLIRFLPRIPVFWGEIDLLRRYIACESAEIDDAQEDPQLLTAKKRLANHIASMGQFKTLNPFEISIINCDYNEVRNYLENTELLQQLGYSDDQIEEMKTLNIEDYTSPEMYAMKRILAFQGDMNCTAERFLFEAYYDNRVDMCNRLFPLMLEKKRGDMILELYGFDADLSRGLKSLKRFYLIAVSIAEEDDDKFFEIAQPEWIDFPEEVLIDRLHRIAIERNDEFLRKSLELQKSKPQGNPFEIAIMEADQEEIRNFVKNANLLVELGYTPDEIQKISKIFNLNTTNNGMKPGQIANRVYLYQKNKNHLAEHLYLTALLEDPQEDVLNDCKALYQIYIGQHNHEMVCKLYEDYLHSDVPGKFNNSFASAYCVSLFELGRYEEFLAYIKKMIPIWNNFTLFHFLLYAGEILDDHELDEMVFTSIKANAYRLDIIAGYLLHVLNNRTESLYNNKFITILNMFFGFLENEDISAIKEAAAGLDLDSFDLPESALVFALAGVPNANIYISGWLEYISKGITDSEMAVVLLKIAEAFDGSKNLASDRLIDLYDAGDSTLTEAQKTEIEDFLDAEIDNTVQKQRWNTLREVSLRSGRGNLNSLRHYIEDSAGRDEFGDIKDMYLMYKPQVLLNEQYEEAFDVLMFILNTYQDTLTADEKSFIVDELIDMSGEFAMDYNNCRVLSKLCRETGKAFEAQIFYSAAVRIIPQTQDAEQRTADSPAGDEERGFYTEHLLRVLNDESYYKSFEKWKDLSKYIELTDEEKFTIEQLRNTIKLAGQWDSKETDLLCKAVFSAPANTVYWKLLYTWIRTKAEGTPFVKANILYRISARGEHEQEDAIDFAVNHGVKMMALDLAVEMLGSGDSDANVHAQKKLREMVAKGWFTEESFRIAVPDILSRISENISLQETDDYIWNSVGVATEITIATDEYRSFLGAFKTYLTRECAKQGTALLAAMLLSGKTEYADEVMTCINSSYADNTHKELVSDIFKAAESREITEAEKLLLELIMPGLGNALSVDSLLGFYCDMHRQDKCDAGLEAVRILIKYHPYDPVLPEVAASFLISSHTPGSELDIYNYLYDYSSIMQNGKPIQYIVGRMICAENYFRHKGIKARSFRKLIADRYPVYNELVKNYQEFCDCINVGLRSTGSEEFAEILFAAIFTCDWTKVFSYKPLDLAVETVLEKNIKTDRVNVAYDFYRSVIQSIARFLLTNDDLILAANASRRIRFLWKTIDNVGCTLDYFSEKLQNMDGAYIPELVRIWSLDIETLTVFKKYFGEFILSHEHCEKYADLFSIFINASSGDIFSNNDARLYLRSIDPERAKEIARAYEVLYIRNYGPNTSEVTGTKYVQESNYEKNIFSNYLRAFDPEYLAYDVRAERFRKKYRLICEMKGIHNVEEAGSRSSGLELNEKLQIFSLRALYYYYASLSGTVDSNEFGSYPEFDFINAVIIAFSDDHYFTDLSKFISLMDTEQKEALGILILSELNKLDSAAKATLELTENRFRSSLCSRLVAAYGGAGNKNELCIKCKAGVNRAQASWLFWIKNYHKASRLKELDPWVYIKSISPADDESGNKGNKQGNKTSSVTEASTKKREQSNEKIFLSTAGNQINGHTDEDASSGVPDFIISLLESEDLTDELSAKREQWKARKEIADNASDPVEAQSALDEVSIEIGLALLHENKKSVDETLMGEVFSLVKPNSVSTYLVSGLHDILQTYICSYSSIDQLASSAVKLREPFSHLCFEQSEQKDSRVNMDIRGVKRIIDIVLDIAADLSSAMGEDALKDRLHSYHRNLVRNTKDISVLRSASFALGRMIQDKINNLNYVPKIEIYHTSDENTDKNEPVCWTEKWYKGAVNGYIRGVVANSGGAPAVDVTLNVMVKSEIRCRLYIEKIDAGRKIPFAVPYYKSDIGEGEVRWSASVSYPIRGRNTTVASCLGVIHVSLTEEEWDSSLTGIDFFNAESTAEGDRFFGRSNEMMRLGSLYKSGIDPSGYPSLLITGLRRAGKSSVIKRFKEELKGRDGLAPLFVDAQMYAGNIAKVFYDIAFLAAYQEYKKEISAAEFKEFRSRWSDAAASDDWVSRLPSYFMELSEILGGRKIVFFMDEMENVFYSGKLGSPEKEEEFYGMIRALIQNYQGIVSFIFCGSDKLLTSCLEQKRESQMFQVLQRIYIGRMSSKDIRDMFNQYNSLYDIKFGNDAVDAIMGYTNGLIWYTKLIAKEIIDRIINEEQILRQEVHPADVDSVVELLIRGDLGTEKIDLLDYNFGTKRKAIIRALARATSGRGDSISTETIFTELTKLNYVDNDTGEVLGSIPMDELIRNLNVLQKMDFIESDPQREQAYRFTTEIYRILMRERRRIDKFVIRKGAEN
ncbi:MAG: ATP-binding protein [Mogibacterium sp.]|nr:ATP-binding protein [Mogibacterium sp.]